MIATIKTANDLLTMERRLNDHQFSAKLMALLRTKILLNGQSNGEVVFRDPFRMMVQPNAIKPYSWKGQSRTNKKNPHQPNLLSFKTTFPRFIMFIDSILKCADTQFVMAKRSRNFCGKNTPKWQDTPLEPANHVQAQLERKRFCESQIRQWKFDSGRTELNLFILIQP